MAAVRRKPFDGGDFLAGDAGNFGDAGARGFAVDMHGASAAERHAAAKFRSGHVQRVAKHPEQRHVRADVDGLYFTVESESNGHRILPPADKYPTTIRAWMKIYEKLYENSFRWPANQRPERAAAGYACPLPQK